MARISDHSLILVATENSNYVFKKRQVQLENAWLGKPELNEIVERTWNACVTNPLFGSLRRHFCDDIETSKKRI